MSEGHPSSQPVTVKRVIYKEIKEGDRRKFIAESNDADSGGGARDLRYSPFEEFRDVFSEMFPEQRGEKRKRQGISKTDTVLVGEFYWMDNGIARKMESRFEAPTDARSFEGRIAKVHTYPCFENLPDASEGMVILLLVQRADGTVWPSFATERSLSSGEWDDLVSKPILECVKAHRRANVAVAGFIDFEKGKHYCNGD